MYSICKVYFVGLVVKRLIYILCKIFVRFIQTSEYKTKNFTKNV